MDEQTTKTAGRPLGKTNLSEDTKLSILIDKKSQLLTQSAIAKKHDTARETVNRLSEDDLAPETQQRLKDFVSELAKARDKVIQRINEKLDNDTFKSGVYPQLLTSINNAYRLETDQSTANVNVREHVEILRTWIAQHHPSRQTIEQSLIAVADANRLDLTVLRAEILGGADRAESDQNGHV